MQEAITLISMANFKLEASQLMVTLWFLRKRSYRTADFHVALRAITSPFTFICGSKGLLNSQHGCLDPKKKRMCRSLEGKEMQTLSQVGNGWPLGGEGGKWERRWDTRQGLKGLKCCVACQQEFPHVPVDDVSCLHMQMTRQTNIYIINPANT